MTPPPRFVLTDRKGQPVMSRLDPTKPLGYSTAELAHRALPYVATDRQTPLRIADAR